MNWYLRIFCLLALYVEIKSSPLDNSTIKWEVHLGTQNSVIAPVFSSFGDSMIAIASISRNESNFQLETQVIAYFGGEGPACKFPLIPDINKILAFKITGLQSQVLVSLIYEERTSYENRFRYVVISPWSCECHFKEFIIHEDERYSKYSIPHVIVPYENDTFDIFVKSSNICEDGICKISINRYAELQGPATSFVNENNTLQWSFIPVEPYLATFGYYFFSTPSEHLRSMTSISTLSSNGTLLKSIRVPTNQEFQRCLSNEQGHLGYCSSDSITVRCLLFGQDLEEKLNVSIPLCRGFEDCRMHKMSMLNTPAGGFVLNAMLCLGERCKEHLTLEFEVNANGHVDEPVVLRRTSDRCALRNDYEIFRADTKYRCSGAPCMIKRSNNVFDVSVLVDCTSDRN